MWIHHSCSYSLCNHLLRCHRLRCQSHPSWSCESSELLSESLSKMSNKMLYLLPTQAITRSVMFFDFLLHMHNQFLPAFNGHQCKAIPGQPFASVRLNTLALPLIWPFTLGHATSVALRVQLGHRKAHNLMLGKEKRYITWPLPFYSNCNNLLPTAGAKSPTTYWAVGAWLWMTLKRSALQALWRELHFFAWKPLLHPFLGPAQDR